MNATVLIAAVYLVASALTFAAFGLDKRAARLGRRRIPEARLHLFELLGGFPGALLGRALFRHKRQKARYTWILRGIALLHVLSWSAWAAWRAGWIPA